MMSAPVSLNVTNPQPPPAPPPNTAVFDGGPNGGGTSWADAANWMGDVLPNSGSNVQVPAGFSVTLDSGAGAVIVNSVQVSGILTSTGSLTVRANSSVSGILSSSGQLIVAGGATLTLNGTATLGGEVSFEAGASLRYSGFGYLEQVAVTGLGTMSSSAALSLTGDNAVERLVVDGGFVQGQGNLTVSHSFAWSGGQLGGTGTITNGASSSMTVDTGGTKILAGTFVNQGSIEWRSEDDIAASGALRNHGTLSLLSDGDLVEFSSSPTLVVTNYGTIAAPADTFVDVTWAFQDFFNHGTINVLSGEFEANGWQFRNLGIVNVSKAKFELRADGSSPGQFTGDADSIIEFASGHTLSAESSVASGGAVLYSWGGVFVHGGYTVDITSIQGGAVTFANNLSLPEVLLGGHGVLQGASTVSVTRRMVWTAGTMQGGGTTEIAAGATLVINEQAHAGEAAKFLGTVNGSKRDLINRGTVLWYDGLVSLYDSTLTNHGTFRALGDDDRLWGDWTSSFVNIGQFLRQREEIANSGLGTVDDTGYTSIAVAFEHTGTFDVHTGSVNLAWAALGGNIRLAPNAQLSLGGITEIRAGAAVTGLGSTGTGYTGDDAGVVVLHPMAVLHVNHDVEIPKVEMQVGSTITGPEDLTISSYLDWRGGEMTADPGPPARGTTQINEDAFLLLSGSSPKFLRGRILNNLGRAAWSAHPAAMGVDSPAGDPNLYIENVTSEAGGFRTSAASAGDEMLVALASLRGDTENPAPNSLLGREELADAEYVHDEDLLSDQYADRYADLELEYQQAIQAAEDALAAAPPGDPQAEEDYWEQITQAEEAYDLALQQAGEDYQRDELLVYQRYQDALSYAKSVYLEGLASALAAFRQGLWNAGHSAQPDILAAYENRTQGGVRNIFDLALDLNRLLRGVVLDMPPPVPGWAGNLHPPSVAEFFSRFSADTRAALQVAYHHQYGVTLEAHVLQYLSTANAQAAMQTFYTGLQPPPPPSGLAALAQWVDNGVTWLGNTWDSAVTALSEFDVGAAWDAATTFLTDTATMMVTDPIGFARNVGEGIVNTTVAAFEGVVNTSAVVVNQFTFGLVPELNQYANSLAANNGFYRFVNVTAVFGREVVIGLAGGAAFRLAGALAINTGRVAGNLLTRVGAGAVTNAIARAAPNLACRITSAQRMVQPYQAYSNVGRMAQNFQGAQAAWNSGDYETAAALMGRSAGMVPGTLMAMRETGRFARAAVTLNPQRVRQYLSACFAAGTPILEQDGAKSIEDLRPGDRVWARPETEPLGPLELKVIEECFDRTARVVHLHVSGRVIRTTDEHPFWAVDRGWVKTNELKPGDRLVGVQGDPVEVREIFETQQWETVYNFRVADFHTYFVGSNEWGFSVWAHNSYQDIEAIRYSASPEGVRLRAVAHAFRNSHIDGANRGRNIATASVVVNGQERTVRFINDPNGMHAEDRLIAWVSRLQRQGRTVQVNAVYSERRPCPMCAENLAVHFGSDLSVFHSQGRGLLTRATMAGR